MKTKQVFFATVIFLLFVASEAQAQWTGNSIYSTTYRYGNVAIGGTSPATRLHLRHTSGSNLFGTSAFGGLHLEQTGGNDRFVGITTDATSYPNTTQGGILLQGGGSYGTKIHFLTTDSYAAGMKQRMVIDHQGKVGIGTNSPETNLHIRAVPSQPQLRLSDSQGSWDFWAGNNLHIREGETDRFYIKKGGGIGIGTTQIPAGFKLVVDGKMICEEVRVEMSQNWPDYVFDKSYDLMPLDELANHIKTKNHLPGIPSAAEVAEEGVEIGEMQRKMMEKIEELTLYMLQQQETIEEQQKAIEALQGK